MPNAKETKSYMMKDMYCIQEYEKLKDEKFSTPYSPKYLFDIINLKEEIKNKLSELERTLKRLENLEKGGVEKLSDNVKNYLSDEKKETAIKIALESKGNVRKRKIAVPLLMILGIVIIFSSIFLIINSPAILWYVYMVIGIVCLLLAFNAKSFQKFVLKKAELLLDKSFRTGIVEYHFDAEGIETISQMGYSKNYWTAFKEYGTMGQYIYVKRKDNKMVLIDKNDLSTGELEELTQLLLNNVKM